MKHEPGTTIVNPDKHYALYLRTTTNFFIRLWRLLSNPFLYLFTGKLRY